MVAKDFIMKFSSCEFSKHKNEVFISVGQYV